MKNIYYSSNDIDSRGAHFNIIIGERSNGKSYDIKHKKGIRKYLFGEERYIADYITKKDIIKENIKAGTRFFLLRRSREEIRVDLVEAYFSDVDVMGITDNKYNCITMYKRALYLSKYDTETGKTTRGEKIGYVGALSVEQNYAGAEYLDVTDIIFEEFISRSGYLGGVNECSKLMNFYCTIDRKRGTTKMWLLGNTISKICPYFDEWELRDIITHQKQGTIEEKWLFTGTFDDDGNEIWVKVAIEYCRDSGRSSFTIGKHKEMLNKGSWQVDPQPHLSKSYNCYKMMFRMIFFYKSFKFIVEYLFDKETKDSCWYVYPYKGEIKNNIIVFSDQIRESRYWQRDIYNPLIKNKQIVDLLKTFKENRIFYASDSCGTDFKQAIDFEIRK